MPDDMRINRGEAPPIPFGWYTVAYSDEVPRGHVKPMHFFDRDFVLWRGEDDVVRSIDAFCAHLGAHLGHGGKVVGNDLVCPFHNWAYAGNGTVTDIPYSRVVPPQLKRSCLPAWPVAELNRTILVWYHPDRIEPLWQPFALPELSDPNWAPFQTFEWEIRTHLRDIAENSADIPHFFYVHGVGELPPPAKVTEEGWRRETLATIKFVTKRGQVEGTIRSIQMGPGQGAVRFEGLIDTILIPTNVPVSRDTVMNRFAFTQPVEVAGTKFGNALINEIVRQVEQDIPIWNHKRYDTPPTIVQGDGDLLGFRRYFNQFYPA